MGCRTTAGADLMMAKVTKDHDNQREKSQHEADSEVLSVKADFALVRKGTNENAGDWGGGRGACVAQAAKSIFLIWAGP